MGLEDKLATDGSNLSLLNGADGTKLKGAEKASKLHAFDVQPGYSITGDFQSDVNNAFNEYDDGVPNPLVTPSELDLQGEKPSTAYLDNLPPGAQIGG